MTAPGVRFTGPSLTGPGTGRPHHRPADGDSCRTSAGGCDGSCESDPVVRIDFARDFSRTPGGRYESDGSHSAEEFRRVCLEPALAREGTVTVDLDGAVGFASSFLEEAFGGLVRKHGCAVAARVTVRSVEHPGRAAKAQAFMVQEIARQSGGVEVLTPCDAFDVTASNPGARGVKT